MAGAVPVAEIMYWHRPCLTMCQAWSGSTLTGAKLRLEVERQEFSGYRILWLHRPKVAVQPLPLLQGIRQVTLPLRASVSSSVTAHEMGIKIS